MKEAHSTVCEETRILTLPIESSCRLVTSGNMLAMATNLSRSMVFGPTFTPAKLTPFRVGQAARTLSNSVVRSIATPKESQNLRKAPRVRIGTLKAPIINSADKYQTKADNLHRYGAWLMGCLPKYIQQFSVWKDELTVYISPPGVIPVFSFLKCSFISHKPVLLVLS